MIRNYAEKWSWMDDNGKTTIGLSIPKGAKRAQRVPFFIKYITKEGNVEQGQVITLSVDTHKLQRKIQFVQSNEIRIARDYLIVQIDKVRFITH